MKGTDRLNSDSVRRVMSITMFLYALLDVKTTADEHTSTQITQVQQFLLLCHSMDHCKTPQIKAHYCSTASEGKLES